MCRYTTLRVLRTKESSLLDRNFFKSFTVKTGNEVGVFDREIMTVNVFSRK